jgi:hypothetical protein
MMTDAQCRVCQGSGCILQVGGPLVLTDMSCHSPFPRLATARVKRCDACDGTGVWGHEKKVAAF